MYRQLVRSVNSQSEQAIEVQLCALFTTVGYTLAVAESITGGLIGSRITDVPGSSRYFAGGIIAYGNDAKVKLLGVRQSTLEAHGAVSASTAIEMARGARDALRADVAVSVTGVAGPGGGSARKPVGTTYIGIATPAVERAVHYHFQGDRLAIKADTAEAALRLVYEHILAEYRG